MTPNTEARAAMHTHRADFAWCEEVIRTHSKSFYTAFSGLPREKRQAVYAIYAFCREADDIADERASREELDALVAELDSFAMGHTPDKPMWRALGVVFDLYGMDTRPFYDMLAGQRRDLDFAQPQGLAQLEEYCYYVAGSVGLMLLPVLCAASGTATQLRESAVALGIAMQLTNILRDVGEDLQRGRCYLPKDLMHTAGCSVDDLRTGTINAPFVTVWEALAARAEVLYLPLQKNIAALDEDSRLATLGALYLYRGILGAVRAGGYDCFAHRAHVTRTQAAALLHSARCALQNPPPAAST